MILNSIKCPRCHDWSQIIIAVLSNFKWCFFCWETTLWFGKGESGHWKDSLKCKIFLCLTNIISILLTRIQSSLNLTEASSRNTVHYLPGEMSSNLKYRIAPKFEAANIRGAKFSQMADLKHFAKTALCKENSVCLIFTVGSQTSKTTKIVFLENLCCNLKE